MKTHSEVRHRKRHNKLQIQKKKSTLSVTGPERYDLEFVNLRAEQKAERKASRSVSSGIRCCSGAVNGRCLKLRNVNGKVIALFFVIIIITLSVYTIITSSRSVTNPIHHQSNPPPIQSTTNPIHEINNQSAPSSKSWANINTLDRVQSKRIRINASDPVFQQDLIRCFSSIRVPFQCDINEVGRFNITEKIKGGRILVMRSLDEQDYGTEYVIKPQASTLEFEVVDWLSQSEKSRNFTARSHPRYPFLKWNNRGGVFIMERLQFVPFDKFVNQTTNERELMTFLADCYHDLQSVYGELLKFKDKLYVHDDMHYGQVIVSPRGGQDKCHLIDFDILRSLNDMRGFKHYWISPFWSTKLTHRSDPMFNNSVRSEFVQENGIEEFQKRGEDIALMELRQLIVVNPMLSFLQREQGWPGGFDCSCPLPQRFTCSCSVEETRIKMWCSIANLTRALIERSVQEKGTESSQNDTFVELIRNHHALLEMELTEVHVDCTE